MRSFGKNFLVLMVTLLITLSITEAVLRAVLPAEPEPAPRPAGWAMIPERTWVEYHPVLGWLPLKNVKTALVKNGREIPITTNAAGLRSSRDHAPAKPAGTTRICAVGDSFTFGFGVQDDEAYPAVLEKMHSGWEVLNMGVPGYGVDQIHLLFLEAARTYRPDTAIIAVYPEDFWRSKRAFNDAGNGKPYYRLMKNGKLILNHSPVPRDKDFSVVQFPELIERAFPMNLLMRSRLVRLCVRAWGKCLKRLGLEDPDTSDEWILGRAILKETIAEARRQNIRVVFMLVPPIRWITGSDEPVRQSLRRFAMRENFELLDLTDPLRELSKASGVYTYYIKDDDHWTPEGHRKVAEILESRLKGTDHEK